MRRSLWWPGILLFILIARLAQVDLLWVEEGYPTAAALQMLAGRTLYRDIWFDKPPLFPAAYILWGAKTGIGLRVAGALFVFACALILGRLARRVWGENEGIAAGALLAFHLTFGIPSAVMALAPDLLMILPHIAAIYFAWRGRAFLSGIAAGLAMLVNTKAVFVLAACALWQWRALPVLAAGFALPNAIAAAWLASAGALGGYWQQVWQWGLIYSRETFVTDAVSEGLKRTLNWAGFQAAIVLGAAWTIRGGVTRKFSLWICIALAGVAAGNRFFPRYYFLLLPPVCLLAARAFASSRRVRVAMLTLMVVPVARFGPRLINHRDWPDLAMMNDSRAAAQLLNERKQQGDTLLVWGYRPDIYAFTRIPAGTEFLDSQPLTGVIADRHLTQSAASAPVLAAANRVKLAGTSPTYIVDGLGPYNSNLAISRFEDLRGWLANYREIGRTTGTVIYARTR
jgi:hypothetical protein